ncbi:MAG: hypothetical protein AB8B58_16670 [Roseobacter sp.]
MRSGFARLIRLLSMRRGVGASLALLLVACAPSPVPLRDANAPLSASTRFDTARFAGVWHIVASTANDLTGPVSVDVADANETLVFTGGLTGVYTVDKPGVLSALGGGTLVVMWLDETHRTAALGDAQGRFALLLSRAPSIPSDKRAAAFGVFDFYGWDTRQIEERQ